MKQRTFTPASYGERNDRRTYLELELVLEDEGFEGGSQGRSDGAERWKGGTRNPEGLKLFSDPDFFLSRLRGEGLGVMRRRGEKRENEGRQS